MRYSIMPGGGGLLAAIDTLTDACLTCCVTLQQDAMKPGKDGDDLSIEDDEGIDAENSAMSHYSNGSDQFEINRPSATLKHPRRSGKPYVIKPAQGIAHASWCCHSLSLALSGRVYGV